MEEIIIIKEQRSIDLPNRIGIFKIDYLNSGELYSKYKKYQKDRKKSERDEMPVMEIYPMKNKGSIIEIRFTNSWYSRKGNKISLSLEGGSIATIKYDCEKEKFIIENVELWGV